MRVGHGYDVHKLVKGRDLILGGVKIDYDLGLLGHSDADVLVHAIIDSLLGAACLGDIGNLFPDTDKKYKGANSLELLREVNERLKQEGYKISNIDSTIIAQSPKLSDYIMDMRKNIAKACEVELNQVNVKATTEERLGFTGNHQGISSHAACFILSD